MTELEALRRVAEAARDLVQALEKIRTDTDKKFAALREALAAIDAAEKDDGWQDIKMAPEDEFVWVWAAPAHGLPGFIEYARYHEDAGWCVDELRKVTLWHPAPLPLPPRARAGDGG